MSIIQWPNVVENDDGIRPAGKTDECFYCQRKIGSPHAHECVVVKKKVQIEYIFTVEIEVPWSWKKDDIEFQRNDGRWCCDNALEDIENQRIKEGCCCDFTRTKFIKVVDDTPIRDVKVTPTS